ncbi:MAG: DsrE family protein, partial [Proteobacteria bacterium]|nr:DsrE family protein [Pseudomonadota bacterium]
IILIVYNNFNLLVFIMASILFHIISGPNNTSTAMLGFLLARTAVEEGHKVEVFLSGDGVQLVRDAVMNNLIGLGTGSLKEHMDVLKKSGVCLYVSTMSCENRGITDSDLKGKLIKKVLPKTLLDLVLSTDKSLIY